jgi:phospholipase D1/2
MRALTLLANENWRAYVDPATNAPLPYGHLMTYPTWVDADGSVGPLEGCEEFPDLGGKIIGTRSGVLPPILTT